MARSSGQWLAWSGIISQGDVEPGIAQGRELAGTR